MSFDEEFVEDFEEFEEDFEEYVPEYSNDISMTNEYMDTSYSDYVDPNVRMIMQAVDEENKTILERMRNNSNSVAEEAPTQEAQQVLLPQRKALKIGVALSKEEQEKLEKVKKRHERGKTLMMMLDQKLNMNSAFDVFDLPPKSEYELYMLSMGTNNTTAQTSVQCPLLDDRKDAEVNTERPTRKSQATQAPLDLYLADGSSAARKNGGSDLREKSRVNGESLLRFLKNASVVCEALVLENSTLMKTSVVGYQSPSKFDFSNSFNSLYFPSVTTGRSVVDISQVPGEGSLAVAYSETDALEKGMICMWNATSPYPDKVLICEPEVSCSCMVTDKPHLIIAGTADGSLQLWDLRELSNMHTSKTEILSEKENKTITLSYRRPTYSTDWLIVDNHFGVVKRVMHIGYNKSSEFSNESTQIVSMDEHSTLIFWVIVESSSETGISEVDFGLSIGGRVKLVKSGRIDGYGTIPNPIKIGSSKDTLLGTFGSFAAVGILGALGISKKEEEEDVDKPQPYRAFVLESEPKKPTQFLLGVENDRILRQSRFQAKTLLPGAYSVFSYYDPVLELSAYPTQIHYSTFLQEYFLVSYNDGSIALYHEDYAHPLYLFRNVSKFAIIDVRWSHLKPSIFFALDSNSTLYIFDFLVPEIEKLILKQDVSILKQSDQSTKIMATKLGVPPIMTRFVAKRPLFSIALGYSDGRVDVHTLKPRFVNLTAPLEKEVARTREFLETLYVYSAK